jgi:hypothetical protein
MGVMEGKGMPVNVTFAGKGYDDTEVLGYAWAFEQATMKRMKPPLEALDTDIIASKTRGDTGELQLKASVDVVLGASGDTHNLTIHGECPGHADASVEVFVDGESVKTLRSGDGKFEASLEYLPQRPECLGWDLKPLPPRKAMVLVVAKAEGVSTAAKLLWVDYSGQCRS